MWGRNEAIILMAGGLKHFNFNEGVICAEWQSWIE